MSSLPPLSIEEALAAERLVRSACDDAEARAQGALAERLRINRILGRAVHQRQLPAEVAAPLVKAIWSP